MGTANDGTGECARLDFAFPAPPTFPAKGLSWEFPEAAGNGERLQGSFDCGCSLRLSRKEQSSLRMTNQNQEPAARYTWAAGRANTSVPTRTHSHSRNSRSLDCCRSVRLAHRAAPFGMTGREANGGAMKQSPNRSITQCAKWVCRGRSRPAR